MNAWKARRKPQSEGYSSHRPTHWNRVLDGDGLQFIDIRDTSGRQSGFNVLDGKVTVRGVLRHGAEFTCAEFLELAKQIVNNCSDSP